MKMDKVASSGNDEDNFIGKTFGRWTILKRVENRNKKRCYLCRCSCLNHTEKIVYKYNLISGRSKSCGCIQREKLIQRNKTFENSYIFVDYYCIGKDSNGNSYYIDKEDYEKVKPYCWVRNTVGYFTSRINGKRVSLHRFVLDLSDKDKCVVDHINRDKADNRKQNLRLCTESENILNAKLNKNNKSGYKGVTWNKRKNKWDAFITDHYKHIFLGGFENKDDAIEARKHAEEERWSQIYNET